MSDTNSNNTNTNSNTNTNTNTNANTNANTKLLLFGDTVFFDYNELIEKCDDVTHSDFLKVIYYLNTTSSKIIPTKQQFIKIKGVFTKFINQLPDILELKIKQFEFLNSYSDYVASICNNNEIEMEIVYLSMFKPLTEALDLKDDPNIRLSEDTIIGILNSNKHHFNNGLKSKIVYSIFIEIGRSENNEHKLRYIIEILKLLKIGNKCGIYDGDGDGDGSNNGNDEIFKKQEIQITELIKSSFKEIATKVTTYFYQKFANYEYDIMTMDILDWIIQLLGNDCDSHFIISLLIISSTKKEVYHNFIDKYQNLIIKSLHTEYITIKPKGTPFESIVSILIKSKQFEVTQYLTLITKSDVSSNLKLMFKYWLTYDILIDVLAELYGNIGSGGGGSNVDSGSSGEVGSGTVTTKPIKQSDLNSFIIQHFYKFKGILYGMHGFYGSRYRMLSTFQINEDKFINKLDQDEYTLMEIYTKNFKNVFSSHSTNIDYVISIIFSNLSTSPIKKSFLSDKIEYFVEICNLNIINNWILPNFNDECLKSKTYQLKSNSGINLQSINKQLSNVLIDEIFKQYLNNNSTTMYQKLQLSLVSKKSFQRVKSLMSDSTDVPIPVTRLTPSSKYDTPNSLFDCNSIKYLKYFNPFIKSRILFSQIEHQFYSLLNKCKSLEILDISSFLMGGGTQFMKITKLFNWLNWYNSSNGGGKLKKLIITVEKLESLKPILEFQALHRDIDITIQLCSDDYITKERKSTFEFEKFNISKLKVTVAQYFRHGFLNTAGISTIRNLQLSINLNEVLNNEEIILKYLKKYSQNWINQQDGSNSLSNLRTLELMITANSTKYIGKFIFYKELLNYFGSKVSSNLKEIRISFSSVLVNHSIIEMIFKIVSNNPSFNSVYQISIHNQTFNKLSSTYQFIQQPLNYNGLDTTEFIRNVKEDEVNREQLVETQVGGEQISKKRKFDEIDKPQDQQQQEQQLEEEKANDFNTDTDSDIDFQDLMEYEDN